MPSKPILSEENKLEIRNNLKKLCEQYWTTFGYKKTSVKKLCEDCGISIGTFYTLYPTKENLFFETLNDIQKRLTTKIINTNQNNPTKEGFAKSIKELFREYDAKPFLYNVNSPDFQSFISKLPKDMMEELKFNNVEFSRKAIQSANLKLKVDEYMAYGILSSLLLTITAKETLSANCDYFEIFDFMIDNLIPNIFESE